MWAVLPDITLPVQQCCWTGNHYHSHVLLFVALCSSAQIPFHVHIRLVIVVQPAQLPTETHC